MSCLDCGEPYSEVMALDLAIPREQWLLIHPEDGGLLCANCIIGRASRLPGVVNITGRITFQDDSFEVYEAVRALGKRSNSR